MSKKDGTTKYKKALGVAVAISAFFAATTNAATYSESPQLQELVKQGKLPAVEKRLPQNPLIITPNDSIGQYGGTLNLLGLWGDNGHRIRTLGHETLFSFDTGYTKVGPGIATGFSNRGGKG